ncbi:hypothetical protein GCK32_000444 [Trichostrongylus colubriformis]|uniref:Uncharacterized protein n=1 Tax=Trichostrongylus colubriformis TaxID=6319 RepID=A0AAN8G0B8_TRICO
MTSVTYICAQSLCALSMLLKVQLLFLYRRLSNQQRNIHFNLLLISSLCFAAVTLFLSFDGLISYDPLRCTSTPTIVLFVICHYFNDASLIGYGVAFFPICKPLFIVIGTVIGAFFCATAELLLAHSTVPILLPCDSSQISSEEVNLGTITIQLLLFVVLVLLLVAVIMHERDVPDEANEVKRVNSGYHCVVSILVIGGLSSTTILTLLISNHGTNIDLVNYSSLTIIYSIEGCLIPFLAVLTCPVAKALFRSSLRTMKKKAQVSTAPGPQQQMYCSMHLRSRRKRDKDSKIQDSSEGHQPSTPPPKTLENEQRGQVPRTRLSPLTLPPDAVQEGQQENENPVISNNVKVCLSSSALSVESQQLEEQGTVAVVQLSPTQSAEVIQERQQHQVAESAATYSSNG